MVPGWGGAFGWCWGYRAGDRWSRGVGEGLLAGVGVTELVLVGPGGGEGLLAGVGITELVLGGPGRGRLGLKPRRGTGDIAGQSGLGRKKKEPAEPAHGEVVSIALVMFRPCPDVGDAECGNQQHPERARLQRQNLARGLQPRRHRRHHRRHP